MSEFSNTKKPAVFLKTDATKEQILAAVILHSYLKSQTKPLEIILPKNETVVGVLKSLAPDLVIKHELTPRKYILSFKKDDASIDNVQWQQDKDQINIYISLEKGTFVGNDYKFTTTGSDYDLAILPRISNLNQLGELASKNEAFFKEVKLITIGSELNPTERYKQVAINRPNISTLSEQIFTAIDQQLMTAETAQFILAGIMLETESLTKEIKNSEIFMTLKKLVDKGAKTDKTAEILAKLKPMTK